VFVSDAAAAPKPSPTTKLHTSGGGGADGEGGPHSIRTFRNAIDGFLNDVLMVLLSTNIFNEGFSSSFHQWDGHE